MSVAPTLSARGQRALVRPPLLKYGFLIRHPHSPSSLPGLHSHPTESATSHADDARCALFENQFCESPRPLRFRIVLIFRQAPRRALEG